MHESEAKVVNYCTTIFWAVVWLSAPPLTDRVTFLLGRPQNVTIGANETVQAVLSAIPINVAFITLQFHTQDRNATLSYDRVRKWPAPVSTTAGQGLGVRLPSRHSGETQKRVSDWPLHFGQSTD